MLPRPLRIRRARDFALLSQKGRVVFAPFFTLRFRESHKSTKVGFVTSAKIFKTAVARNRTKRRLREVLRLLQSEWPKGMDLLFIAKADAKEVGFGALTAAVRRAFEKIPEALKAPPRPRLPKARKKTSVVFKSQRV